MDKFLMGRVLKAKGLDGTLKCSFAKDDSAEISDIKRVIIGGQSFEVLRAYGKEGFAFFKVKSVDTIEDVQELIGKSIEIEREFASPLGEDEYYITDLIGCKVYIDGVVIGAIASHEDFGGGDVFSVATSQGEVLVPFAPKLVKELDVENRKVVFDKKVFGEVCELEV